MQPSPTPAWQSVAERATMTITILHGDCRDLLPTLDDGSVQTCVTSPPYWGLRDYGVAGQIGREPTLVEYVQTLVAVFREVRRVLRDDATLWLNLGDAFSMDSKWGGASGAKNYTSAAGGMPCERRTTGLGDKQLLGLPWRVAFALQDDGWILRSDIIWHKPNVMPESVKDRPTRSHEYLFLFAKSQRYYYDADAIKEAVTGNAHGGKEPNQHQRWAIGLASSKTTLGITHGSNIRNRRSVWAITTTPTPFAHFATFPEALVEPCILAGSRAGDTVLDPFGGSGTTARVAERLQRNAVLCELNPAYIDLAERRTDGVQLEAFV